MKESDMWQQMRKHWGEHIVQLYRVENRVAKSMPDVHFVTERGMSGWIELKVKPIFQPGQESWIEKYAGFAYVLGYSEKHQQLFYSNSCGEIHSAFKDRVEAEHYVGAERRGIAKGCGFRCILDMKFNSKEGWQMIEKELADEVEYTLDLNY